MSFYWSDQIKRPFLVKPPPQSPEEIPADFSVKNNWSFAFDNQKLAATSITEVRPAEVKLALEFHPILACLGGGAEAPRLGRSAKTTVLKLNCRFASRTLKAPILGNSSQITRPNGDGEPLRVQNRSFYHPIFPQTLILILNVLF